MTKTLTEQWKNGGLESGYYYIKVNPLKGVKGSVIAYYINYENCFYTRLGGWDNKVIKEVLAPVPSYEEWHKLKDLGLRPDYTDHIEKWEDCARLTRKVKRLQEQIKEANNIIVKADWDCDYTLQKECGFSDYLVKYGIEGIEND